LYQLLENNHIKFFFVLASCTSEIQPLDAQGSVNANFKLALKEQFNFSYSEELEKQLKSNQELKKVDLHISTLKALHAGWFLKAFDKISNQNSIILAGWENTGIMSSIEANQAPAIAVWID